MVIWGFGVGVLDLVYEVGVFSWWGLGPVVWGSLGFYGLGSLYKHKIINLGKILVCYASLVYVVSNEVCKAGITYQLFYPGLFFYVCQFQFVVAAFDTLFVCVYD